MKTSTILLMLLGLSMFAQNKNELIGYWQSEDVTTRYYVFSREQAIDFSISDKYGISSSYYNYGFYDNLKLPSIDSLKEKGNFYFEVNPSDFDEDMKDEDGTYRGIQANVIEMDDDRNRFQMYDVMRPGPSQRAIFKRINQLPPKLAAILKSKGIIIAPPQQDTKTTLIIKSTKARIYTEPDKPSKMFLVKGDSVRVLQEKENWFYILYTTTKGKEIKGWVKKEDLSSN